MYYYDSGWMREWRPEGEIRVRFAPEPVCEQWRPSLRDWNSMEPEELWISDAERCKNRLRRKKESKDQGILPGMMMEESTCTPPREDPGYPAYRLWRELPEPWMPFLERVRIHPWRGLTFLSEFGEAAEDLFSSNSGLAWLLSATLIRGTEEEREASRKRLKVALRQKQRDQLALLDLPCKPWMVKMVRKLQCDQAPMHCLQRLRCLDRHEPLRKIFQHVDTLPESVMRMVGPETQTLLTAELVEEIASMDPLDLRLEMIERGLKDVGVLAMRGEKVPRFRRFLDLEQWRWQRDAGLGLHQKVKRRDPDEFPPLPFPGSKTILPITNLRLLREEGKRMSHCVATYRKDAFAGKVAVYAIFRPERATLGLRKHPSGKWRVFDFRCRANRQPKAETRKAVGAWLKEHKINLY